MNKNSKKNKKHIFDDGGNTSTSGKMDFSDITALASGITNIATSSINMFNNPNNIQSQINSKRLKGIGATGSVQDVINSYDNYSSMSSVDSSDFLAQDTGDRISGILNSTMSGASAGNSIYPGWGALIGAAVGGLASGISAGVSKHQAKEKAEDANRQIDELNTYNMNVLAQNAQNAKQNQFNQLQSQFFAFGGPVNNMYPIYRNNRKYANGGNFSNGVTSINNGGTHESNPYEGVQIGTAPDGLPNLVEEGEIVFDDYVFSNRLKPNKNIRAKYKMKGDSTFADTAKKIQKESEERPNDPISKNGLDAMLGELAQAQEDLKLAKQAKQARKNLSALSDEDLIALQEQQNQIEQFNAQHLQQYSRGGQLAHKFALGDEIKMSYYNPTDLAYGVNGVRKYSPYDLLPVDVTPVWEQQDFINMANKANQNFTFNGDGTVASAKEYSLPKQPLTPTISYYANSVADSVPKSLDLNTTENVNNTKVQTSLDKSKEKQTFTRYAPVLGSTIGLGVALLDKPNYKYANQLEQVYNSNSALVGFNPLGDYMTYTPMDRNYYLNQLRSGAAGSRRQILNTTGGNRAQAMAGILASDYNTIGSMGKLAREAEEYNLGQREKVANFNRGTNQYNSEMRYKVDLANRENAIRNASLLSQALAMKQAEDDRYRQGIAANASHLFNSLGNIGKENLAWNQNQALIDSGYYGTLQDAIAQLIGAKKGNTDKVEKNK